MWYGRKHHGRFPCSSAAEYHTKKKTLRYAEQLDPEVQKERQAWRRRTKRIDLRRFVFLDESNAKTTMTRRYGRAPRGDRVVDYVPDGRWESVTMLSSVTLDGTTAAMVYEGGTDVAAMQTYVEEFLAPTLTSKDIVVMDNLSSHRHADVIAAIEATGAEAWFLPRYSPDYNPIEEMWSKVKSLLRKFGARTKEALIDAIGDALKAVTPQDAHGWFADSGYPATQT